MDDLSVTIDNSIYTNDSTSLSGYATTQGTGVSLDEFVEKVRRIPIRGIIDDSKISNRD
jgi:hypothetical protein